MATVCYSRLAWHSFRNFGNVGLIWGLPLIGYVPLNRTNFVKKFEKLGVYSDLYSNFRENLLPIKVIEKTSSNFTF